MQHCVVIDAAPVIRKVTKAILTSLGFEVEVAATGRDGLALFQMQLPRLAIVDASITDMAALDVLRQMRQVAAGRVQVIYCTTEFDVLEHKRAHAAGATNVLIKPFDRSSLASKLASWTPTSEASTAPNHNVRQPREIKRTA